jgi:hypothetical protein
MACDWSNCNKKREGQADGQPARLANIPRELYWLSANETKGKIAMAKVTIENAEVTSVMTSGKGFRAQTIYKKRDGGQITEKWVVWTDKPVRVGNVVNIEGLFSKKDETFTNDEGTDVKYTALHVNNATVTEQPSGPGSAWLENNALPIDEEAPF